MSKSSFLKNNCLVFELIAEWDNGIYTFPKSISQKVIIIARLNFELAHYNFEVHHVSN